MKQLWRWALVLGLWLAPWAWATDLAGRSVVFLTTYQYGLPSPDVTHRAIQAALKAGGINQSDIFTEHLDLARVPGSVYRADLAQVLRHKFESRQVGVLVVEGEPAIDFITHEAKDLFPGAAVLTYGAPSVAPLQAQGRPVMDLRYRVDAVGTLRLALQLFPATRHVLVVSGASDGVLPFLNQARADFAPWAGRLSFDYTHTLTYGQMMQQVAALPPDTVVIYAPYFNDSQGRTFVPLDVLKAIRQASPAPVFALLEVYLGQGAIGGSMLRNESMGAQVGKIALDYLNGRLTLSEPVTRFDSPSVKMLDWRELEQHHVEDRALPPGTVVLNRPPTLWDQHRGTVVAATLLFLALVTLAATLALFNRRLQRLRAIANDSEERMRSFFENVPVGIFTSTREGKFLYVNPTLPLMLGYASDDELMTVVNRSSFGDALCIDAQPRQGIVDELSAGPRRWQTVEDRYRRKDGKIIDAILSVGQKVDTVTQETVLFGVITDITERKAAQKRIEELAFFDPLTQLPNRTLLMDRLRQAMTAGKRNSAWGAVLLVDLDNFKTVNDTLGHEQGDRLLQQVARRLGQCVREGDTVARLGGDEFVVVLGNLKGGAQAAATQTEAVGDKMLADLAATYALGNVEHPSTACVGATLFHGQETPLDELLKQADLALVQAKASGRNALRFFDPLMQTVVMERAELERGLRHAIQAQQFVLHYQAQVTDEGRVTGAEVLVRWQHPQRGMVPPAQFIALAEDTGLILPLGQWVLQTACAQLARWSGVPGLAHLTLAVNVSARQFHQPDFVEGALRAVQASGANPERLKLELTESLLVSQVDEVAGKMSALKAHGVRFSLDDFGTGFSSLAYLKRLPLDQLKIDQSFVRDVLADPNDASIARTIIALAQSLGLNVIAEGVETGAQRDFLAAAGCPAFQGYLFSRPVPVEDFEVLARRGISPMGATASVL